jgi:hypothetical protein
MVSLLKNLNDLKHRYPLAHSWRCSVVHRFNQYFIPKINTIGAGSYRPAC